MTLCMLTLGVGRMEFSVASFWVNMLRGGPRGGDDWAASLSCELCRQHCGCRRKEHNVLYSSLNRAQDGKTETERLF